jgi:hypothetical protein
MRVERARTSLAAKGFWEEKRDHYRFFYEHDGKRVGIHTKFSFGQQISKYQLRWMCEQLRLPDLEHLERLLSCKMTGDEYRDFLHRQGVL